jgi:hypothetical protein
MAFVALVSTSVTFQGRSGSIYEEAITQPTAVGYAVFKDNNAFMRFPEDVRIVDGFTSDSVNAVDYLQLWVNSKDTGLRYLMKKMTTTVVGGRIQSPWIKGGAMVQLYHYSA